MGHLRSVHGFKDVLPLDMDIERALLALLLEEADQLVKGQVQSARSTSIIIAKYSCIRV